MCIEYIIAQQLLDPNAGSSLRDQVSNGQSLSKIHEIADIVFSRRVAQPESLFSCFCTQKNDPGLSLKDLKILRDNLYICANAQIALDWDKSFLTALFNWFLSLLGIGAVEDSLALCREMDREIDMEIGKPYVPVQYHFNGNNPLLEHHEPLSAQVIQACSKHLTPDEMRQLRALRIPILSEGSQAVYRWNEVIPRTIVVEGGNAFLLLTRTGHGDPKPAEKGGSSTPKFAIDLKTGKKCMLLCRKFDPDHLDRIPFIQNAADYSQRLNGSTYFAQLYSHVIINNLKDPNIENHWLIFEYCEEGELWSLLNKIIALRTASNSLDRVLADLHVSKQDLYQIFYDVLRGIQELHQLGAAHCDIALENIVLYRDEIGRLRAKIIDLEGATPFGSPITVINRNYRAPELNNQFAPVSAASDIYSLGKMLGSLCVVIFKSAPPPLAAQMANQAPAQRPNLTACIDQFERMIREQFQGHQFI